LEFNVPFQHKYGYIRDDHNMVNFGPLAAEIVSLFGAPLQISTGFASWQRYYTAL